MYYHHKVYMTQTGVFLEIELVFKRICGNKVESQETQESHGIYTTMEKQENITLDVVYKQHAQVRQE